MRFYVGIHKEAMARHFDRAFISVNRIRTRRSPFTVGEWILDSGAFTEVSTHGRYRHPVSEYAEQVRRWAKVGQLQAAVSQDYMCEPWILERTGLSVEDHQRLTIERYDGLVAENLPAPIMPVLQGYRPADYVRHLHAYGDRLTPGMWVGVGSVCKRNGRPQEIAPLLAAIKRYRPDLRLHGFGIKKLALLESGVRELLYSADSNAWSFAARWRLDGGRGADDWREAKAYETSILEMLSQRAAPAQLQLALE